MADTERTSPARVPGPREAQHPLLPVLQIPIACAGVGACLGASAAVLAVLAGLFADEALRGEFTDAGTVAFFAPYLVLFIAPMGALVGGLLGLLISPLVLLFAEREDLLSILFRTTVLALPSAIVFSLGGTFTVSAVGVALTAVGLLLVQLWLPRRGLRVLGILLVLALGLVAMAPAMRALR